MANARVGRGGGGGSDAVEEDEEGRTEAPVVELDRLRGTPGVVI